MKSIKPVISPAAIFRIPKFPLSADLAGCWPDLKPAIQFSSPSFHEQIKDLDARDLEKVDPKIFHSVSKYFNRAKYRPVPYGSFASIGVIDPKKTVGSPGLVKVAGNPVSHDYIDWSYTSELSYTFQELVDANGYLFANSSYYKVGEDIRFVSMTAEGKYEIAEISGGPMVMSILRECRAPVTYNTLMKRLKNCMTVSDAMVSLIEEMIGIRLLITSFDPNIIGQDYLSRRNITFQSGHPSYLILERPHLSGGPDMKLLRSLPRLIPLLQQLCLPTKQRQMKEFIHKFRKKFDQQEIPLMTALDPELGVGYGDLEQGESNDELILDLAAGRNDGEADNNILQRWFIQHQRGAMPMGDNILRLENFKPDSTYKYLPIANSLSAIVTFCDGLVNLEHLGGVTANSLAGRFTLMGDGVLAVSKNIAGAESAANPEIIFFDISYIAEKKVDNVNRRKSIYPCQLSILTYDTTEAPLTLDDITVRLYRGQVILWSKKINKRLVPKYASAYNYSRSDLPLFRFLCDLQHQGIHTNLNFDIKQIIPGLTCYPRIQYDNIIVSPAQWQVKFSEIKSESGLALQLAILKTSRYLKFGSGDQKLVIDTENEKDLLMLYTEGSKTGAVFLEEAFIPEHGSVQDEAGNIYYSQFVFPLLHDEKIYSSPPEMEIDTEVQRRYMPGSDWLYFEIYCHPSRMDELLTGKLPELLEACRPRLKKWFFIRYNENGHHIRLRLNLNNKNDSGLIMTLVNSLLEADLLNGTISDLQLKTYGREIERYGASGYEDIETHFFKDSQYVFNLLSHAFGNFQKYRICLDLLSAIQSSGIFNDQRFFEITSGVFESLREEHQVNAGATKKMNEQYQQFRQQEEIPLSPQTSGHLDAFKNSFIQCLAGCPAGRRNQLLVDLFHMHVNRLFPEHQRTHEMLIYFIITKEWLSRKIMRELKTTSA